jgi:hypothetical protein
MKRHALAALLAIPLWCSAGEYKFDLGAIPGEACSKTEIKRDNSLKAPVPERTYSRKLNRVVATVVAMPDSDEVTAVVNDCGASAERDLKKTRSAQNIRLFSDLFEEYMSSCVSRAGNNIAIQSAVVEYQEKCEK